MSDCDKCKKETESLTKLLSYFGKDKTAFINVCPECEKEYWDNFREGIL